MKCKTLNTLEEKNLSKNKKSFPFSTFTPMVNFPIKIFKVAEFGNLKVEWSNSATVLD